MGQHGGSFGPLRDALDRLSASGRTLAYWWRDDDATAPSPALERLLTLAHSSETPLALAVIPAHAEAALAERLADAPRIDVLVHGLSHANHAPAGMKKAEFGPSRALEALAADASAGLERLAAIMGSRVSPVFVPPWNRICGTLPPVLPGIGYRGLSAFGPVRDVPAVPGLVRVNTHIDPIAWRQGGGLADRTALLRRLADAVLDRVQAADRDPEPLGLLTHHLVQDEATWGFVSELLAILREHPAATAAQADALFRSSTA